MNRKGILARLSVLTLRVSEQTADLRSGGVDRGPLFALQSKFSTNLAMDPDRVHAYHTTVPDGLQ